MYKNSDDGSSVGCGCFILVMVFNLLVGGWSVNYLLAYFMSETIPFIGAALIGLIVGEISVPVAIVIAILQYFSVL
jgi:hypothetical protein